jgi:hypothetical protein
MEKAKKAKKTKLTKATSASGASVVAFGYSDDILDQIALQNPMLDQLDEKMSSLNREELDSFIFGLDPIEIIKGLGATVPEKTLGVLGSQRNG